ncbi:Rha family transcriptional regulator [Pseudomonas sp. PDM18]|uniref:Rha family transcriptional regulator n=1 Tax=Pseudomonas sp. PDM18 TaxID=2769253 RepID=UPI00177B8CBE|nr:Rha family transcriptional regulator [Pseudomonas sp. PDM18]MBD9675525.1 Rha family transcriptional regulator [Pseudomonas sp. PDM18]
MSAIEIVQSNGEARVDSRALAVDLGNQHESSMKLITAYSADFEELGILRFEIGEIVGRGQPEKFAMLNEDQAYLLLTYSRNTKRVRALKVKLVKAFRSARAGTAINDMQYLPLYRALHDEVKLLAKRAEDCGSTTPERIFHINANKAINAALGLTSGQRTDLTIEQRLLLTSVQAVFRRALHESLEAGDVHRVAAQKARDATVEFVRHAGALLIGKVAA